MVKFCTICKLSCNFFAANYQAMTTCHFVCNIFYDLMSYHKDQKLQCHTYNIYICSMHMVYKDITTQLTYQGKLSKNSRMDQESNFHEYFIWIVVYEIMVICNGVLSIGMAPQFSIRKEWTTQLSKLTTHCASKGLKSQKNWTG